MSKNPNRKCFSLRLPQEISSWLTESAAKRFQSQNALVIEMLWKEMQTDVVKNEKPQCCNTEVSMSDNPKEDL